MHSKRLTIILFMIIFLEGYIVLASELLAIRQLGAFVGNGADTVSIIIAAVLMPLAFGYYAGGLFRPSARCSVRQKLIRNIVISIFFLVPALTTLGIEIFFETLFSFGISNRIVLTTLYSLIFLVAPVFLLGQTVPLISHYFSSQKLSQATGKILFISTTGSFLGSVLTTLVMMHYFGVNNAVNFVFICFAVLLFLLSKNLFQEKFIAPVFIIAVALFLNSSHFLEKLGIVSSNIYNTVSILEEEDQRILLLNKSSSSKLGKKGEKFPYVEYVEQHYISPIEKNKLPPKNILVIGAAGFTIGLKDTYNHYTFVDIDPDIKKIAEEKFLKQKLGQNKDFVGVDVVAFLATNPLKYDFIFMDAYSSQIMIPEPLVTRDFFLKVRNALSDNGMIAANFILDPNMRDPFSRRVDHTFRSVFPYSGRQIVNERFEAWNKTQLSLSNIIYSYVHQTQPDDSIIYTNNKNTAAFDRPDSQGQ